MVVLSVVSTIFKTMNCMNNGRKDFLQLPKDVRHKQLSRSLSPALWKATQSLDEGTYSKRQASSADITKSMLTLANNESSANKSIQVQKSTDQLYGGVTQKKQLQRHGHVDESHWAASVTNEDDDKFEIVLPVPEVKQRRRSSGASALGILLKQTLKVTSQTMGLDLNGSSQEKLNEVAAHRPIDEYVKRHFTRSSSSVSTLAFASSDTSMAPLQCHAETRSSTCLNNIIYNENSPTQQDTHTTHTGDTLHNSPSTRITNQSDPASSSHTQNDHNSYLRRSEPRSIKSNSSETSLQRKGSSAYAVGRNSNLGTSKNEAQMTLSAATSSVSGIEKKHKEVSSSRIKKFHRLFTQICKDEKLINYFSCALVSDILLQGHLYITDKHFAFYSNVFGYITKLVIPTSSVIRVSKEKTAKIIPNAVGVATIDERHVFGSFISREAAFRLMCSVCPKMMITESLVAQPSQSADVEPFEEYFIEDDSSCSISGNECIPLLLSNISNNPIAETVLFKRAVHNSESNIKDIPQNAKTNAVTSKIANSVSQDDLAVKTPKLIIVGSVSSSTTSTPSTSPPTVIAQTSVKITTNHSNSWLDKAQTLAKRFVRNFPNELHVVYVGVILTIVLAFFSIFLLYRIIDIESKASIYHSTMHFNWGAVDDENILAEALRWQKQLQHKSAEEAQQILDTNLIQIGKVRRSLETLSMLIHNRGMVASSSAASHEETD